MQCCLRLAKARIGQIVEPGILDDRRDRLAQIMAHILQELRLCLIGGLEAQALFSISDIPV